VVLHGDFWPGNVLWHGGRVSAVIDWEDAAVGDALSDVGNARLELLFFMGRRAMDAFTREYGALTGAILAGLPYWDLRAAVRKAGRMGAGRRP
jgi:aminoglycoside phosphotransferase (APT) family kinase protein